ncbi:MAG: TRAP transporter small permease [Phycisphaeraceae bacterium]
MLSRLNTGLTAFGGWTLMVMVALLVVDVIWRSFFTPLHAMTELSVIAMMVVIALGLSACEEHGEHVQLEFFVDQLWGWLRHATIRLERLLSLIAAFILLYAVTNSGLDAYRTQESTTGMVTIPLWPVKFIMFLGVFFLVAETLRTLTRSPGTPRSESGQSN